jgi:hypothetical protein
VDNATIGGQPWIACFERSRPTNCAMQKSSLNEE